MTVWDYNPASTNQIRSLSKRLNVGYSVAELLARLDFQSDEEAERFLNPKLSELCCPFDIDNLERAASRISQAIDDKQRIVICGDYDVDGVTSTTLLVAIIRAFENYPHFIVPLRLEEGYGLSRKAVERALEGSEAPDLFIALDCGTNSIEEAQYILDQGCDLIIVDHHQKNHEHAEEVIIINPHALNTGQASNTLLCTVGLVFKLAHGLLKLRRQADDKRAFDIKLRHYLDLVSMGTLADLVPLKWENRIFARIGLQVLAKTDRQGLQSLMKVSGMNANHGVQPEDISFKIGPRINASGRLADASVAVELLLSDDRSYSMETALKLDSFNRERQEIERSMSDDAIKQVEESQADCRGLVVYDEQWHPGVVGIVASRVSRAYSCPSIVLGREGDLAKGSGRSIEGINLVEVLSGYSSELDSWGGHPMAVGISMRLEKVDAFRAYFDRAIKEFLETHNPEKRLNISTWLKLDEVNAHLMKELSLIEPFGQANPEPIFGSKSVRFTQKPTVFKDHHFRFNLNDKNGRQIPGVAWKMAKRIPPLNTEVDIAFRLAWNTFGGRKFLQIELVDWR